MQSPDRHHQASFAAEIRRSSAGSKAKQRRKQCWRYLIRREHWFLDALWYYIHLLYIISMTLGNVTADPHQHEEGVECEHNDDWSAIIAYIVAVFIEFIALIIIFVTPLYQLMKTKKRVFRNVFSNIKIIRRKHNQHIQQQRPQSVNHHNVVHSNGFSENMLIRQESNDSSNSPAQQEFIARIKSTICRNFIAGCISILLFSAFMAVYTFDAISGSNTFFNSGLGYVISFSCYILNYLCLTFSYALSLIRSNLLPLLCAPPWHQYKYSGAKISLVDSQEFKASTAIKSNIPPFTLNENEEKQQQQKQQSSASIPIVKASHNRKGNGSFESLLASSHLSATPKYHTLSQNDNVRMQKQYEEYLKRQQMMAEQQRKKQNEHESTGTTTSGSRSNGNGSRSGQRIERRLLTPSAAQEHNDAKYTYDAREQQQGQEEEVEDDESVEESSEEYDSEGIDSLQLREGSYDVVNYDFSSIGYHDDEHKR